MRKFVSESRAKSTLNLSTELTNRPIAGRSTEARERSRAVPDFPDERPELLGSETTFSEAWASRHNFEIWGTGDWRPDATDFYD